ncbi:hypothetical protein ACJX0J_040655, partial [Zea mays]
GHIIHKLSIVRNLHCFTFHLAHANLCFPLWNVNKHQCAVNFASLYISILLRGIMIRYNISSFLGISLRTRVR